MKLAVLLTTLAFVTGISSSCRKDNDPQQNPQAPQPQNGVVSYRIDNQYRQAVATYNVQNSTLITSNTTERLELRFPANQTTYQLTNSTNPSVAVINLSNQNRDYISSNCSPANGTISVTGIDQTTITGTFSARICTPDGQVKLLEQGVFTRIPAQ